MGSFTSEEIASVSATIAQNRTKDVIGDAMAEMLKDADVLQHYLYDPVARIDPVEKVRLHRTIGELGLGKPLACEETE